MDVELKAGKLYHFTAGDYSDYRISGTFIALQNVSKECMKELYDNTKSEKWYEGEDKFIASLIREGYLLDIDTTEIHVDTYRHRVEYY